MSVLPRRHHVARMCVCGVLSNQIWNNKQEFIQSDLVPVRVSYDNGGLHVIGCMTSGSLCRPLCLGSGGNCFCLSLTERRGVSSSRSIKHSTARKRSALM